MHYDYAVIYGIMCNWNLKPQEKKNQQSKKESYYCNPFSQNWRRKKAQISIKNNEPKKIHIKLLLKENNWKLILRNMEVLPKFHLVCQPDLIFNIQSKPNSANKLPLELKMKSR